MRYGLVIEYDGSFFSGWQWQEGGQTVQGCLQQALKSLTQEEPTLGGAGRTDKGVHALGQVAHTDIAKALPLHSIFHGLNFYLKKQRVPVRVTHITPMPPDFHARFSALSRQYVYKIFSRGAPTPLWQKRSWWISAPLNIPAMVEAAKLFQGTHDFSSFRCSHCQASSPIRTLDVFHVEAQGPWITLRVTARSFLHSQVRMMVGALAQVGKGLWSPATLAQVLEARQRGHNAPTAPSHGLYLTQVTYPDTFQRLLYPHQEAQGLAEPML